MAIDVELFDFELPRCSADFFGFDEFEIDFGGEGCEFAFLHEELLGLRVKG